MTAEADCVVSDDREGVQMRLTAGLVAFIGCCTLAHPQMTLQSPRLEAVVSGETGALVSLTDRENDLTLLASSPDRYVL
ncbi:MAG: hypothetical protein J7M38_05750, partial [Armatimonadetes bacterium]|nr:hypothetical protein [Armatimonadota bacterium]